MKVSAEGAYVVYGWSPPERVGAMGVGELAVSKPVPLCTTPCELRLRPGRYDLGLAPEGRAPVRVRGILVDQRTRELTASYRARPELRSVGIIVGVVSIAAGLFVGMGSRETVQKCDHWDVVSFCAPETRVRGARPELGGSIGVAGSLVGLMLVSASTAADLEPR